MRTLKGGGRIIYYLSKANIAADNVTSATKILHLKNNINSNLSYLESF